MRRFVLFLAVVELALAGCGSADRQPRDAGAPSPSPPPTPELVGDWQRTQKCPELVEILTNAGMKDAILENLADDGWIPGVTSPEEIKDPAHPCRGAVARKHSHFFTADGEFGSRDAQGDQVDDGEYRIVKAGTLAIGDVTFHYTITGHDTPALDPVIPDCAPTCFEAQWSVVVAYPGHTWRRIA